ncbi:MAG: tRNA uridine-5-carboxymethylaminomethyl(34) synthesis GTPase MnmE [Oscillospiraceae bacterium]|nr:tRNA uridine-5-carboxymethylaminomethyl(34) synthesis GTPase MnmE [Oscillospiraceae bacterium]
MEGDLIAAIATAAGRSGVGIVRLSGKGAAACAGAVFRAVDGRALGEHEPRRLVYGALLDREGREMDRILAFWSPAGSSYTGEETAELQCHGSPMVLTMALEALFAQGARQAGPGEFTRRAFLNGRLDLVQAEAVMDLIDAETPAGARTAAGQLAGGLSRRVEEIYSGLVDVMAHFHAVLDYPEEELDPFTAEGLRKALHHTENQLDVLLGTYSRGRVLSRGVPCAIVGLPNAGKSSLLNALVGYERAIVTQIPGTTRDTVEEKCVLGGVLLRLIDTAGLRETEDPVERLGVERSRRAMEEAELILVVVDRSTGLTGEALSLAQEAISKASTLVLFNKCDLPPADIPRPLLALPGEIEVSAKLGTGLKELGQAVAELFPGGEEGTEGELLTNARQAEAAGRALEGVRRAGEALEAGVTPDALLTDVEGAMEALGELTGRSVREDVTGRIFERFCVGK